MGSSPFTSTRYEHPLTCRNTGQRVFTFPPRVRYVSNGHNEGGALWGAWR